MKKHERNDHRLLIDTSRKLGIPPLFVIWIAITYDTDTDGEAEKEEAKTIFESWVQTNVLPRDVEDFCLSIMVDDIAIINKPELKGGTDA